MADLEAPLWKVDPGCIVQLTGDHRWADCLAVVEEVCGWGVKADIRVPLGRAGMAIVPLRLAWTDFEPVKDGKVLEAPR